jgi:flagellin-like protein
MKKLRSRRALSPVVASIILIAVTVAVSIAVAAWMGALTFNFMATEQLKITNVSFTAGGTVTISTSNTGTSPITITDIHVNNVATNVTAASLLFPANSQNTTVILMTPAWSQGAQYEVEMRSSKGNQFTYTATAPS